MVYHEILAVEVLRGIGTPLKLDECIMNKTSGKYARVLFYMDLLFSLPQ